MKEILPGRFDLPGANPDQGGVNFTLFAPDADAVELCLFGSSLAGEKRIHLPDQADGWWHGYLPGCKAGQRYGYRVHGPWNPEKGQRFNANKLLIDPYARLLEGDFQWCDAVFDYQKSGDHWQASALDSSGCVPRGVVVEGRSGKSFSRPVIPWSEAVIYETNVRGYTMRHPDLTETERGRFRGLKNSQVVDYIKSLGVTSVELMPVQAFIDEEFLVRRGLRNFWGYNTISFLAPESRYAHGRADDEFRDMVNSLHDAGLQVILDVAFNHTGETDQWGPTVSFRGIANEVYYRTEPGAPGQYINDTGCGNTVNADHPQVQQLVVDALTHWHQEMGVDGFRFDLAPILGRSARGFSGDHPLLEQITNCKSLENVQLIAEPWDPGPGGYQLGNFPSRWSEWNDQYRDSLRRFWRGDSGESGQLAQRLHGSADLFELNHRPPQASINFLTAHDGFTLNDLVSYEQRHNHANGEDNRDGHAHNISKNFGTEGPTADPLINTARRRQRLNLLASLLVSQGVPMLLAGDELGHSQSGNNNAYAQDNETGWIDWSGLEQDQAFTEQVRLLIALRKRLPMLRQQQYLHADGDSWQGLENINWLRPDNQPMQVADWEHGKALNLVLCEVGDSEVTAVAICLNAGDEGLDFALPPVLDWRVEFYTGDSVASPLGDGTVRLSGASLAIFSARCSLAENP